jgi:hypothetical protein
MTRAFSSICFLLGLTLIVGLAIPAVGKIEPYPAGIRAQQITGLGIVGKIALGDVLAVVCKIDEAGSPRCWIYG